MLQERERERVPEASTIFQPRRASMQSESIVLRCPQRVRDDEERRGAVFTATRLSSLPLRVLPPSPSLSCLSCRLSRSPLASFLLFFFLSRLFLFFFSPWSPALSFSVVSLFSCLCSFLFLFLTSVTSHCTRLSSLLLLFGLPSFCRLSRCLVFSSLNYFTFLLSVTSH